MESNRRRTIGISASNVPFITNRRSSQAPSSKEMMRPLVKMLLDSTPANVTLLAARRLASSCMPEIQMLNVAERHVAYRQTPKSTSSVGIVYVPGYLADMNSTKACALEQYAIACGYEFVRFDFGGIGHSTGSLDDMTMRDWHADLLAIVDQVAASPRLVIVGSSMGGWLSFHAAMARAQRIAGILSIAPSVDFVGNYFGKLPAELRESVERGESVTGIQASDVYQQRISRSFVSDSLQFNVLHLPTLQVKCPVRIIHGCHDESVPWQQSLTLMQKLSTADVDVHLRKTSAHRMSDDGDICLLRTVLENLLEQVGGTAQQQSEAIDVDATS